MRARFYKLCPVWTSGFLVQLRDVDGMESSSCRASFTAMDSQNPLEQDAAKSGKMSKSNPDSGIFMHDDAESIRKIKKAWCESGMTEANPLLEIARQIIFHENKEITVERPEKFGGNVTYTGFEQMHADFANSKLHPGDLKETVSKYLIPIVTGLAQKFSISDEARRTILDRST